jgi:AcrR family transcriptional regulator
MNIRPKQARALKKRDALIAAGIEEFRAVGFAATTSKSIAERAGVATGTFYQNFPNKDALLCVIAQQRVEELKANVELVELSDMSASKNSVAELFTKIIGFVHQFHAQNPELHQVLEERRHLNPALEQILAGGEQVMMDRVKRFVQSFNVSNPSLVANNLFAMAEGLVHRQVFGPGEFDSQAVVEQGAAMLAEFFNQLRPQQDNQYKA